MNTSYVTLIGHLFCCRFQLKPNRGRAVKVSSLIALFVAMGLTQVPLAYATQNISGTITTAVTPSTPISGIHVTFLDALNAEPVSSGITGVDGFYNSGHIPSGSYRIRFPDPDNVATPKLLEPKFFGSGDFFCSGQVIELAPGATKSANDSLKSTDPTLVVEFSGEIGGRVLDASTSLPLQGIRVSILSANNAQLASHTTTDSDGTYKIKFTHRESAIRVRFSDPLARYFPEYFGAEADDFCQGDSILVKQDLVADASLVAIPPAQLIQNMMEVANSLPTNTGTMLRTPLIRTARASI